MSSKFVWEPKNFSYELERSNKRLHRMVMGKNDHHPLKLITVKEGAAIKLSTSYQKNNLKESAPAVVENADFIDPLSAFTAELEPNAAAKRKSSNPTSDFLDPLSAFTAESDPLTAVTRRKSSNSTKDVNINIYNQENDATGKGTEMVQAGGTANNFEPWSSYKMRILNKYSTDQRLSISMATIASGESFKEGHGKVHGASSVSDKMKTRLGQLDDFEEGGFHEMQNLTQQEFINKIHELKNMLSTSWNSNQKVKALKIAIQCAKLLNDTSVMQFYPSKFVLVADLLDTFGCLVFERILSKCEDAVHPEKINTEAVPAGAREICINWMLKIASIRELLPRLYIEAAIIRCHNFIKQGDGSQALVRLTNMAKGVGNPLVAVYARAYLCHVGVLFFPTFHGHLKYNFYDFLFTFKQVHRDTVRNTMALQKVTLESYLNYHIPAIEWILSCLACGAHEATLNEVMEKCNKSENSLLLVNCCLSAYSSDYIAARALTISKQICASEETAHHKLLALEALGRAAVKGDIPEEDRLMLLNEVWKFLKKIRNPEQYLTCAETWMEYASKYFTKKEVNTILADIIQHMTPDRAFERLYPQLHSTLAKALSQMQSAYDVFAMDKFLPYLDMFQHEGRRADLCRDVATFFIRRQEKPTSDPVVVNAVVYFCKAMHDSLNSLSLDDQKKDIGSLISSSVAKVTFHKDFEQQLAFYVTCRATFYNLDAVLSNLVHAVNELSVQVTCIVKRNHTRKTAAFVRACTAFNFITIPSLANSFHKLALYLESGQVALNCQCVTQADAMFRSAIAMIVDIKTFPGSKSPTFWNTAVSYTTNLLSCLLLVPDNTDQGVLYLLRGFLNAVSEQRDVFPPHVQCTIYINVLSLLTAYSQDQYLYRIDRIDSNETLYSKDPKFLQQISVISGTLLDEILAYLASMPKEQSQNKLLSACALQMFETVVAHGDVSKPNMRNLAVNVWKMSNRSGVADTKAMLRIISKLKTRKDCRELVEQLPAIHSRA